MSTTDTDEHRTIKVTFYKKYVVSSSNRWTRPTKTHM